MNQSLVKSAILLFAISLLLYDCESEILLENESQKPNVILIYADDLGYGDVTSYNPESKIKTPNIDKLANEGMRFTDAHSPASFCTPSRYSILTGKYCWRARSTSELQGGYGNPIIQEDEMTLGNLFRKNGYKTAAIGKWHVGMRWTLKDGFSQDDQEQETVDHEKPIKFSPIDQGFDYYFGTSGCTSDDPPFAFIENRDVIGTPLTFGADHNVIGDGDWLKDILMAPGWRHEDADTIFTNKAIQFIEEQTEKGNPFFVYLPLSLPHIPWAPAEFVKGTTGAGPRGDLVALLDYCVGELTHKLESLGIEKETIIIFTSDNGPREGVNGHRSAGNFRGYKGSLYEGGHRVPFIIKWPGKINAGSESNELIGQTDIYSTLASILNYSLTENEAPDSYDFSSLLLGRDHQKPIRDIYVHHYYGIRKGDWKLIFDIENIDSVSLDAIHAEELYNLKDDLAETQNLIETNLEVVKELKTDFLRINNQGYSRPK
ncbi:MAG: arylsulfatase [Melioribacteraceae bacterium]|nr:arylsulfatase [Melioribacteraceae bacterium]